MKVPSKHNFFNRLNVWFFVLTNFHENYTHCLRVREKDETKKCEESVIKNVRVCACVCVCVCVCACVCR